MNRNRRRQPKKQQMSGQVAISGVHPVRVVLQGGRATELWVRKGANEHRLRELNRLHAQVEFR